MIWRFTIIDRNNAQTVVDEPVGWEDATIKVIRDDELHGMFFDFQGNTLSFYGGDATLIKDEYEQYGAEGNMRIRIEVDCGAGYEELYVGRLLFPQFKWYAGDTCYCQIPVETTGEVIEFRNRFDQKVNLHSTTAFDGTTSLQAYKFLPVEMTLASKAILLKNKAINNKENIREVFASGNLPNTVNNIDMGQIEIGFDTEQANEFANFGAHTFPNYTSIKNDGTVLPPFDDGVFECPIPGGYTQKPYVKPLAATPLLNWSTGASNYIEQAVDVNLSFRVKGEFKTLYATANRIGWYFIRMDAFENVTFIDYSEVHFPGTHVPVNTVKPFDYSYSDANFTLNPGDRIYLLMTVTSFKDDATANDTDKNAFSVTFDPETFFESTFLSITPATACKVGFINECFSRVAEAITNDKIRAYSEFYGRTDSEPYAHAQDGEGSLKTITNGLFIRRVEDARPTTPPQHSVSMQDLWRGASPIDNIGMGIEPDTQRTGYKRLRIEPWYYFYDSSTVLTCNNVQNVERAAQESKFFSTFRFGYEKWEAEEFTGLDEFLTKRGYRTQLSQVKNELSKLSTFVASGYAWEVTRRKGNIDSKDWRFDNDTFVVCVKRESRTYTLNLTVDFLASCFTTYDDVSSMRKGDVVQISGSTLNNGTKTVDFISDLGGGLFGVYFTTAVQLELAQTVAVALVQPGVVVEQGNITTATNVVDPDTIYNFRISPVRNAMRWMNVAMQSYRSGTGEFVFTDGEGNYYASGLMTSTVGRLEGAAIAENVKIEAAIFDDATKALPLMKPELVTFEYPLSFAEYLNLVANPNGIVAWNTSGDSGAGWVKSIEYKVNEGTAKFTLIEKFEP